jgi:hypothetical protein
MPVSIDPAPAPMRVAQETNAQAGKTSIGHDSLALSRSSFSSSTIPRQTLIGGEEGAVIESRQSMPDRAKVEVAQKTEVQRVSCPPAPDATPNSKDLNDASLLDPCSVFMNSFEGNDSFQFSDKDDSMVVDLPIVTDESLAAEKQAAEAAGEVAGDRIIDGSPETNRRLSFETAGGFETPGHHSDSDNSPNRQAKNVGQALRASAALSATAVSNSLLAELDVIGKQVESGEGFERKIGLAEKLLIGIGLKQVRFVFIESVFSL